MYVTVLSRDPEICAAVSTSLRSLGVPHGAHQAYDKTILQNEPAKSAGADHLVLVQLTSTTQDSQAITQLLRLGEGKFRVVGMGRSVSSDHLLNIIRAGAIDYVDLNHDIPRQIVHLFERVQDSGGSRGPSTIYLPVVAPSGGCGATFLITNLACALANLNFTVCLLDLKVCGGDSAAMLKLTPRHTFQSLVKKGEAIDSVMLGECLLQHDSGVQLLASPEPLALTSHTNVNHLKRIVETAGQKFSFVLYEVDTYLLHEAMELIQRGDRIVIPVRLDFVSVYRAKRYLDLLRHAGVPAERPLVIANRTGRPNELLVERVEEVLGVAVEHEVPEDAKLANISVNIGMPITISHPQSILSQRIFALARCLSRQEQGEPAGPHTSRWWHPVRRLASILGTHLT